MPHLQTAKAKFSILGVLRDAWHFVDGSKLPIWAIAIFIGVVAFFLQWLIMALFSIDPQNPSPLYRYLLVPVINNVVIAPFFGGAVMVAVFRARGEPASGIVGYHYFSKTLPLMLLMLIIAVAANLITYLAHLPSLSTLLGDHVGFINILGAIISILVYVFSFLSVPLLLDKKLSPLQALLTSCRIIASCWLKTLVLIIIVYACFIIAMIPLYIAAMIHPYVKIVGAIIVIILLFWLIPFLFLVQGVVYHRLIDTSIKNQG